MVKKYKNVFILKFDILATLFYVLILIISINDVLHDGASITLYMF